MHIHYIEYISYNHANHADVHKHFSFACMNKISISFPLCHTENEKYIFSSISLHKFMFNQNTFIYIFFIICLNLRKYI